MRIAFASDHGGFELRKHLIDFAFRQGYEIIDFGTSSKESCDYPDFAYQAALSIKNKEADYGVLVCTTGIGVSIVANKVKGVRCALVNTVEDAILTKQHNNTNCLALGQKNVSNELAEKILCAWLEAKFLGGRHENRVNKIKEIEGKENE